MPFLKRTAAAFLLCAAVPAEAQGVDVSAWLRDVEAIIDTSEWAEHGEPVPLPSEYGDELNRITGWRQTCGLGTRFPEEITGAGSALVHDFGGREKLVEIVCNWGASSYTAVLVRISEDWEGQLGAESLVFPRFGPVYDVATGEAHMGITATPFAPGLLSVEPTSRTLSALAKARGIGGCGSLYTYHLSERGEVELTSARYQPCEDRNGEPPPSDPALWPLIYPEE